MIKSILAAVAVVMVMASGASANTVWSKAESGQTMLEAGFNDQFWAIDKLDVDLGKQVNVTPQFMVKTGEGTFDVHATGWMLKYGKSNIFGERSRDFPDGWWIISIEMRDNGMTYRVADWRQN